MARAATRRGLQLVVGLLWLASALLAAELGVQRWSAHQLDAAIDRHPALARQVRADKRAQLTLTPAILTGPPGRFPSPVTRPDGGVDWVATDDLTPEMLLRPPLQDEVRKGVVRIAFVGDSTTHNGYPKLVEARLQAQFGADRIEVLNLGVPAARSDTTVLLMARLLPRWRPHLVVHAGGRNDLVIGATRARAQLAEAMGRPDDSKLIFGTQLRPRGLIHGLKVLVGVATDPLDWTPAWRGIAETTGVNMATEARWEMARLMWRLGGRLWFTTLSRPDVSKLDTRTRERLTLEIGLLWPGLGTLERYERHAAGLDAATRALAFRADVGLIDAHAALGGDPAYFTDLCHRDETGWALHAAATVRALAPVVADLLSRGAPPATPRGDQTAREITGTTAAGAGAAPGDGHASDAKTRAGEDGGARRCRRGPCPAGACFVAAGRYPWGFNDHTIAEAQRAYAAVYGVVPDGPWFDDDGPAAAAALSAFCIDRTEVTEATRQRCIRDGACPPYRYRGDPQRAAVTPTWQEAVRLCAWRGGRLPTDAEWEAASRGPRGEARPWSGSLQPGQTRRCGPDCRPTSGPAPPPDAVTEVSTITSPLGLHEVSGNLWEWVADCFATDAHCRANATARDPVERDTPDCRHTLRGGSFRTPNGVHLERRAADAFWDVATPTRGVRCVYQGAQRLSPLPAQAETPHDSARCQRP